MANKNCETKKIVLKILTRGNFLGDGFQFQDQINFKIQFHMANINCKKETDLSKTCHSWVFRDADFLYKINI